MQIFINDVIQYFETIAPAALQESYDNCGLIVGLAETPVTGVLITLDCTEQVIDEAINNNCNLIIAHHPIIFGGLKKINGKNYVERTVIKAIKNNIAIYAIHTNLDNVLTNGVNKKIADILKLKQLQILLPKTGYLNKLVTFVPKNHIQAVEQAIYMAGAGHIGNYSECGFSTTGFGSFKGNENANPFVGKAGERHYEEEVRLETIFPSLLKSKVINALLQAHPYEEVAYDIYKLENQHDQIGSGITGILAEPMPKSEFLNYVKNCMQTELIKYTESDKNTIEKVAICGGSGSFLLNNAKLAGADAFITSDFKYHEFFDAENKIMICDIGHYESEKFTKELLNELIVKKFNTFAVILSKINTNPVKYYY
ncbi:MAG: Nif3-like dinuclear metal center hexameric protein [Bacteroidia bacterium]